MTVCPHDMRPITPALFPCPGCGAEPIGTIDSLVCRWLTASDGTIIDWEGDDLDTQETLYRDALPILACPNGHAYTNPTFTAEVMQSLHLCIQEDQT